MKILFGAAALMLAASPALNGCTLSTTYAGASKAHVVGPAPEAARVGSLTGTVGPSFTISMSRGRVTAGRYRITVRDRSTQHNFHLVGPGVNRSTRVGTTGTVAWTVRLQAGSYRYRCDPHAAQLHGRLKVIAR